MVYILLDTECTRLIHKCHLDNETSNFITKVFRHIMDNASLTESLLEYLVLILPGGRRYFVSSSLRSVLKVTTQPLIITALVNWGIPIEKEDIMAAANHIPDTRAFLLDLILAKAKICKDKHYYACINTACNKALLANKRDCVLVFIVYGSRPSRNLLSGIPDLLLEPIVQTYLDDLDSVGSGNEEELFIDEGDRDATLKV